MPAFEITNLSNAQLKSVADRANVDVSGLRSKVELVQALMELDAGVLADIAAEYLYAGRTGMVWFRFGDGAVDEHALTAALTQIVGRDPFGPAVYPQAVTDEPFLIEAIHWRPGKVVFRFVVQKRVQLVLRNMQLVSEAEDELFILVLRTDCGVIEARCSSDRARSMRGWIAALTQEAGTGSLPVDIAEPDADALRAQLNGQLAQYTGKETGDGSIYDTRSMSKSPACDDLATEQQFVDDTATLDPVNEEIVFTAQDGTKVRILVGLKSSSLYFRTMASEAVLDEVFNAVRAVKGF